MQLDLSAASLAVARRRLRARGLLPGQPRGLAGLRLLRGPLERLRSWALPPFDFINLCGVLHHIPRPAAALATLRSLLRPGGGVGVMVYGSGGRLGVYSAQARAGSDARREG